MSFARAAVATGLLTITSLATTTSGQSTGVASPTWDVALQSLFQIGGGACCFLDGSCGIEISADCEDLGGTYQGDGSDCPGVTCAEPFEGPTGPTRLELIIPDDCVIAVPLGTEVTVELWMFDLPPDPAAIGFQAFLNYDPARMTLDSLVHTLSPFEISLPPTLNTPDPGDVNVAAGVLFNPPTTDDALLVTFTFTVFNEFCPGTLPFDFRLPQELLQEPNPPSRFSPATILLDTVGNPGLCITDDCTPGSCCLPGGTCDVLSALDCAAMGGAGGAAGSTCVPDPCLEPPPNDDCIDRVLIPDVGNPVDVTYDLSTATPSDPPFSCDGNSWDDVWFNYVAPCTGTVTILDSSISIIEAWSGTACPPTDLLGCDLGFVFANNVNAGDLIKIRVGDWQGSSPTGTLTITCTPAPTGACCLPDDTCAILAGFRCDEGGGVYFGDGSACDGGIVCFNDNCRDRLVLTDGSTPFNTLGATQDGDGCFTGGTNQPDLWFNYIASLDGVARFDLVSDDQSFMQIFDGTDCIPTEQLVCFTNNDGERFIPVLEGQALKIRVAAWSNVGSGDPPPASGTVFVECIQGNPPDCLDRSSVLDGVTPYLVTGARSEPGIPRFSCDPENDSSDIWFDYIASCTGIVVIDAEQTTGDSRAIVEAYAGLHCPPTDSLGCGRESFGTLPLAIPVNVGDAIKIRVGSWRQGPGQAGNLSISCEAVQACCLPAQPCQETAPTACLAIGGTPQGEDSDCVSADCPVLGACCFPTGACTIEGADACDDSGGVYQGDNVLCQVGGSICEEPGACCASDGSCTRVLEAACDATGGQFQGAGSTCDNPCPQPGACCFADLSCQTLLPDACQTAGGLYVGPNTICDAPPCASNDICDNRILIVDGDTDFDLAGATINPDLPPFDCESFNPDLWYNYVASCTGRLTIEATASDDRPIIEAWSGFACPPTDLIDCDRSDPVATLEIQVTAGDEIKIRLASWQPDGNETGTLSIACAPDSVGACCFADLSCQELTQFQCSAAFGQYQGDLTLCADVTCTTFPIGACCFNDTGACSDENVADCAAAGGAYQGDGILCAGIVCPLAPLNDDCDGRIEVFDGQTLFDLTSATDDPDAPEWECGSPSGNSDVWFNYVATCDGLLTIDTVGSYVMTDDEADTILEAWRGFQCPPTEFIDCDDGDDDDIGAGVRVDDDSILRFPVLAGDQIKIRVGEYGGDFEYIGVLNIRCDPTPVNDDCGGRIEVFDGETPFSLFGSTFDPETPLWDCGDKDDSPDIWFNYVATCDGQLTIDTLGSAAAIPEVDTLLEAWSGFGCPPTELIECDDDSVGDDESELTFAVMAGDEIKIRVGGDDGQNFDGVLNITCVPPPIGACCFFDSSCLDLTGFDCIQQGGLYQGDGFFCSEIECPTVGACCLNNGQCTIATIADCEAEGGLHQGDGVACAVSACPQPSACCLGNGVSGDTCVYLTELRCDAAGGVFRGEGTLCEDGICFGSCCFAGGVCDLLDATECVAAGGLFQDRPSCDPNPCPQDFGACCFPNGSCTLAIGFLCEDDGGTFLGAGSTCNPNLCPQPPDNDNCDGRIVIEAGATEFDLFLATVDENADPWSCVAEANDIWFNYVVTCNGSVRIFVTEAGGDVVLEVYSIDTLGECPPTELIACEGITDTITVENVNVGDILKIRVGGILDAQFTGTLNIECIDGEIGACCFNDGSCEELVDHRCDEAGGDFVAGDCTPNDCPPATGACCFADGDCTVGTAPDCDTAGGEYSGNRTDCAPNDCPQPGACCFDDGSCDETLFEGACDAAGGDFQGDNTTCLDVAGAENCPQPGACCFDDGSCADLQETACDTAGGDFEGEDTACGPAGGVVCPQPGSCCFDDGSCEVILATACATGGGAFGGEDTSCTPNPCDGACCFDDGSCDVLNVDECAAGGGSYTVFDTGCAPNLCPQPTGACCFDDGDCELLTDDGCGVAGGDYSGDNTACVPNDCPQPTGACCFADTGACSILDAGACDTAGGTYSGDDTVCVPNDCPQPTGACCFDDGTCTDVTDEDCGVAGGDFQGDNTICNPCPQPEGACCFSNGSCTIDTAGGCVLAGGLYSGDDTVCVPNDCTQPTGACCFASGICTIDTLGDCSAAGGLYSGDDTGCAPNDCPQPPGACCLDDQSCLDVTEEDCDVAGGLFQGDGTACDPFSCTAVTRLQLDAASCVQTGSQFKVTLSMFDLLGFEAAGFQGFLEFDTTKLTLASGAYTAAPFPIDLIPIDAAYIAAANVGPTAGLLDVASGIDFFVGVPTTEDAELVSFVFETMDIDECAATAAIGFRDHKPPSRITNLLGDAADALLVGAPDLTIDGTTPDLTLPADLTLNCTADTEPPATGTATATDNCDDDVSVSHVDAIVAGGCAQSFTIERTWTATDECGNETSGLQTIFVTDLRPPVILEIPPNRSVPCDAIPDPQLTLAASDTCDESVTEATYDGQTDSGDCTDRVITRSWTVTDTCGNSATTVQLLFVIDSNGPIIDAPADITVACGGAPDPGPVPASDACDETVTEAMFVDDDETVNGCTTTIVRTWSAMDACGNTTTATQTITEIDTDGPIVADAPADVTVECDAIPAPRPTLAASDACDDAVTEATLNAPEIIAGTCSGEFTMIRSWTAMDTCGNSTTVTQTLTIFDDTAPVVADAPADVTVECDSIPVPPASLGASDNCDESVTGAPFDGGEITPGSCEGEFTMVRSWTATDDCGNSTTVMQTITVVDTTGPVVSDAPADITVECDAVPAGEGTLDATDACDSTVTAALLNDDEVASGDCVGESIITRSWTATDDCGNETTVTQTITVVDTTAPVIADAPADVTIECDETVPGSPSTLPAEDNCDEGVTETDAFVESSEAGACPQESVITRTWTATDDCGNESTATQTITIVDTTPPVVTAPDDVSSVADAGGCDATLEIGTATASDNCDDDVTVSASRSDGAELGDPYPAGDTTVTWTATDACGNTASDDQTVTVDPFNLLRFDLAVQQNKGASRCIQIELVDCDGESVILEQELPFVDTVSEGNELLVPCGDYQCIRARDPLHTLWSVATPEIIDGAYDANFVGADWLIGGELNGDGEIDILDFTIFSMQFFTSPGPIDCDAVGPNADSNADGIVDVSDFTFIQINFFMMDDECCGGQTSANPVLDITTDELWRRGLGHHTVADLNGDGRVNQLDVALFASGIRPTRLAVYTGADGGSWFDSQNWAGGQPDAKTDVAFEQSVKIDQTGAVARHVTVRADGTLRLAGGTLTARSLTIQEGATLRLDGQSVLAVESLTLEAGAALVWNGGTIEVAGGVFTQADFDLVIGDTPLLSTMRLTEGGVATIGRDTYIGFHAGDLGVLEVVDSTFATGETMYVGTGGTGWLVMAEDGLASARQFEVGAAGHVTGDGRLEGDVTNDGVIAPNGVLHVDGALTQVAGELAFQLTPSGHDQLVVTGDVTLAGTLRVIFAEGYVPAVGASFDLVVTDLSVMDQFERVVVTALEGRTIEIVYDVDRITLIVGTPTFGAGH